jgi:hypothetical protein
LPPVPFAREIDVNRRQRPPALPIRGEFGIRKSKPILARLPFQRVGGRFGRVETSDRMTAASPIVLLFFKVERSNA